MALPASSPMATSVGLQIVCELQFDGLPLYARSLVRRAIGYLEKSFNPSRFGWFAVPVEVNDYPHAPWWTCDEETGMTPIDAHWGNPSAELIGYLFKYAEFVEQLDTEELVEHAIAQLLDKQSFQSEHEVYCYLRLHMLLPRDVARRMEPKLRQAVATLVSTDPASWEAYVPQPVYFAQSPRLAQVMAMDPRALDENLHYLVDCIRHQGGLRPTWQWGQYPEAWARARQSWSGVKTLEALLTLKSFGRIQTQVH